MDAATTKVVQLTKGMTLTIITKVVIKHPTITLNHLAGLAPLL
jgi:hypothetical protein